MKRKLVLLLTGICIATMLTACGGSKDDTQQEENAKTEQEDTQEDKESTGSTGVSAVKANVNLGEYKGLALSVEKAEVTEESVKEYTNSMIAYYPAYEKTDKEVVEEGDIVDIDYEGLKDDVAFDGGTASGYKLEIGSNSFIDGFEDGLIGVKVGEKTALNLTFPENYSSTDLAGQDVVFNVTVNSIVKEVEMTYDTLTDEYVSSNFAIEGVDEFIESARQTLESTNEYYAKSDGRSKAIDKLIENCTVEELDEALLSDRITAYKKQFEATCNNQYGMELSEYLEQMGMTEDEYNEQVDEYVEENLNLEMILLQIAVQEDLTVDEEDEDYTSFVSSMLSSYGYSTEDEMAADYGESYAKDSYLCNEALNFVYDNADITYVNPADETEEEIEEEVTDEVVTEEDSTEE